MHLNDLIEKIGPLKDWLTPKRILLLKPIFIAVTCLVFLSTVTHKTFVIPKQKRYHALEKRLKKMVKQIKEMNKTQKVAQTNISTRSNLLGYLNSETQDYVNYVNKRFIMDAQYRDIAFSSIDFKHSVRLKSKEIKAIGKAGVTKTELRMTITGSYKELAAYLQQIQSLPVLFNYQIVNIAKGKKDTDPIKMSLTLQIFFAR